MREWTRWTWTCCDRTMDTQVSGVEAITNEVTYNKDMYGNNNNSKHWLTCYVLSTVLSTSYLFNPFTVTIPIYRWDTGACLDCGRIWTLTIWLQKVCSYTTSKYCQINMKTINVIEIWRGEEHLQLWWSLYSYSTHAWCLPSFQRHLCILTSWRAKSDAPKQHRMWNMRFCEISCTHLKHKS